MNRGAYNLLTSPRAGGSGTARRAAANGQGRSFRAWESGLLKGFADFEEFAPESGEDHGIGFNRSELDESRRDQILVMESHLSLARFGRMWDHTPFDDHGMHQLELQTGILER